MRQTRECDKRDGAESALCSKGTERRPETENEESTLLLNPRSRTHVAIISKCKLRRIADFP